MSGYTKNIYEKDLQTIKNNFTHYIRKISMILPKYYNLDTIIYLLQQYYPYEWQILNEKYEYYCKKDKKLSSLNKKVRYLMPKPERIIEQLQITQNILSKSYKDDYITNFDSETYLKKQRLLNKERIPKINKIKSKVEKAKLKAQEVEPLYLDELIGLYERKNTTQMDRVYIFKELEKYYCPKVVDFFKKKVDSEYNRQLREMAFYHLQSLGHFVVLRKQKYMRIPSKNKKRRKFLKEVYANQTFNISAIPTELEYRIRNAKDQNIKEYDFFISHSSSDFNEVQNMIKVLNINKKNVYCDWISDKDYLKRHLVGNATKTVIEKRLNQSKRILFIKSDESLKSDWVKYELNYFYSLGRPMFEINKDDVEQGNYNYTILNDLWFYDENYKNINLFK